MTTRANTIFARAALLAAAFAAVALLSPARADTEQQPKPVLMLEAKWGATKSADVPLGVELGGMPYCFSHMAVLGKRIFIADNIFGRIAVFQNGKLVRSYPLPTWDEIGLVTHGKYLFELGKSGNLWRMDLATGKAISSEAPIISPAAGMGMLPLGAYTLYAHDNQLVINRGGEGPDVCAGMDSLRFEACTSMPKGYYSADNLSIALNAHTYATIVKGYALLHDETGAVIARAYWPYTEALCADGQAWAMGEDGVYFTEQSEGFVRVYFQPWNRHQERL